MSEFEDFRIKPPSTDWIGYEITVGFSCTEPPEIKRQRQYGCKSFGLILSHEYEIEALITRFQRISDSAQNNCDNPVRYEFDVTFYIADVVGLGINIGRGTGTFGIPFKSRKKIVTRTTRTLCCDQELAAAVVTHPVRFESISSFSPTAVILGMSALATAFVLSVLNWDHPSNLPRIFIFGLVAGIVLSVLAIFKRLLSADRADDQAPQKRDEDQGQTPMLTH